MQGQLHAVEVQARQARSKLRERMVNATNAATGGGAAALHKARVKAAAWPPAGDREGLLAGKPMALIAQNPDHLMTGERLRALGAGIVLPERPAADSADRLLALLESSGHADAARAFAARHADAAPRAGIATTLLDLALAAGRA